MPLIFRICSLFMVSWLLVGCAAMTDDKGVFRDRKFDYRQVVETPRMEMVEGLDDSAIIDLYVVPPLSPYADKDYIYKLPIPNALIVGDQDAVSIQTLGAQQWILVNDSPSRLWPRLKQYLSLNGLFSIQEKGAVGMLEAKSEQAYYLFRVEQGFQRNTSEIYIRALNYQTPVLSLVPLPQSTAVEQEKNQIETLAQFLADVAEKPAYSYIARGISARPKMRELQSDDGFKSLLLEVQPARAKASVLAALKQAQFKVIEATSEGFSVQYHPLLSESDKPGFWGRLFGKDPDGYDSAVPYAGRFYHINLTAKTAGLELNVKVVSDAQESERNLRNEKNQIVQIIKGHLN